MSISRTLTLFLALTLVVFFASQAIAKESKPPSTLLGASVSDDAEAFYAYLAKTVIPERVKKYEEGRRKLGSTYPSLVRPFDMPLFVYSTEEDRKADGFIRTYHFAVSANTGSRTEITFQSGTKIAGNNWVLGREEKVSYRDFGGKSRFLVDGNALLRVIPYASLGGTAENLTLLRQFASFLADKGFAWEAMAVLSHMHLQFKDQRASIELFVQEWMEWTAYELEYVEIGSGWFNALLPMLGDAAGPALTIRDERKKAYDEWLRVEAAAAMFITQRTLEQMPLIGKGKAPELDDLVEGQKLSVPGYDVDELKLFIDTVMKDGCEKGSSEITATGLMLTQKRYDELKALLKDKPKDRKLGEELRSNIFHWENELRLRMAAIDEAHKNFVTLNATATRIKANTGEYFDEMAKVAIALAAVVPVSNAKKSKAPDPLELNNGFYYYEMAEVFYGLAGITKEASGKKTTVTNEKYGKEASKYYTLAVKYMHNQSNIYMRLGRLESAMGNLGKAMDAFEVIENDTFATDKQRADAKAWKQSVQAEASNNAKQREAKERGTGGK